MLKPGTNKIAPVSFNPAMDIARELNREAHARSGTDRADLLVRASERVGELTVRAIRIPRLHGEGGGAWQQLRRRAAECAVGGQADAGRKGSSLDLSPVRLEYKRPGKSRFEPKLPSWLALSER